MPVPPEKRQYPILEYDDDRSAIIEPTAIVQPIDIAEHCVLCFFHDVIAALDEAGRLKKIGEHYSEIGYHPVYEAEFDGKRFALMQPGVGAPLSGYLLDELIVLGCKKFIACGGAGVLDPEITVGHLIVPTSAIRDEGTSYHYLPPGREVAPSLEAVAAIERVLTAHKIPYLTGKTWTNDAIFRETPGKVELRRAEGCLVVEMEASAFFAIARFRGVTFGQILYGGDDVSGGEWDDRDWVAQTSIREKLLWLAAEACLQL
jgi:uridine phosphorylase